MPQLEPTVSNTSYAGISRALDLVLGFVERLGLQFRLRSTGEVIDAARRATGLKDMGSEDFLEPFEKIVENVRDLDLAPLGGFIVRQLALQAAMNRLHIREYLRVHPEVERPIFILGFPRTGTTLLQNLLSLDPNRRALEFWELNQPVPVLEDVERDRRRRTKRAAMNLRLAYLIAPEMRWVHEIKVDTAEECWPLFANTFSVFNYDLGSGFEAYGDWLLSRPMVGAYREYKTQLQILAHRQETRGYLLKCPEHLWFLDELLEVFPDAGIVWTHRDPAASVASYSSLISLNRRTVHGSFDPPTLGAHIEDRLLTGITRAMEARARHSESHFFDVDFKTLVADQPAMVRRVRDYFDLPPFEGEAAAMAAWLGGGRSDKKGMHKYSMDQFNLDPARIHKRYAAYIERFQIPVRAPSS